MKLAIKTKALLFSLALGSLAIPMVSANAAVAYTAGDLILGVRSSNGAEPSIFELNLGSNASLLEGSGPILLGNIGDILTAQYGSDWYSANDLYFGVIGVAAAGDPAGTIYASQRRGTNQTSTAQSAAPFNLTDSGLGVTASYVTGLTNTFIAQNAYAGTNGKGVLFASDTAGLNTWSDYAKNSGADFNINSSLEQRFDANNNITLFGVTDVQGAVDLYRITTGNSPNNIGVYQTTIVIRQNGDIYAVPEPSTYLLLGASLLVVTVFRRRLNVFKNV